MSHGIAIAVIGKVEPLRQPVDGASRALHRVTLRLGKNGNIIGKLLLIHVRLLLAKAPGSCNDIFLQGYQRAAVVIAATAAAPLIATARGLAKLLIGRDDL